MNGAVTIRDRRELPFFMVYLRALASIRENIAGPPRARALGLYVLLCQIANEQRATGERRRLTATYAQLTRRGSLSSATLRKLLRALEQANVARLEVRVDRLRGSIPSLIHLPIQEDPWSAISVAMADHLAASEGLALLPALGLLATLLEYCEAQRADHGGQRAEVTRSDIARRMGLSADRVDDHVRSLEHTRVLTITRRRSTAGPNLPSLYDITEAPPQSAVGALDAEGGNLTTPSRQTESTGAAASTYRPGASEAPPGQPESTRAAGQTSRRRTSQTPTTALPPNNARAASPTEQQAKNTTPLHTSPGTRPEHGGQASNEINEDEATQLCEQLVGVLCETRGQGPARRYSEDRAAWQAAAARILAEHPLGAVLAAIAYLPADQVIGTKVRGMADLERHIEDLRHRAHVAQHTPAASTPVAPANGAPDWPAARAQLQRAIQRHGAGAKAAALAELQQSHPLLCTFATQVGWNALCQHPMDQQDTSYRIAWLHLTQGQRPERSAA